MFNNYKKLHEMEEVVASADLGAVIREARGGVYPSEGEQKKPGISHGGIAGDYGAG